MRWMAFGILFAFAAGCGTSRSVTRGIEQPDRMEETVLWEVPVGTPIEDARRFMEREGFRCKYTVNSSFGGREGVDFLYCDRHEGEILSVVSRRWQIAIIHRDGKVVEVLASTGLIGP